MSLPAPAAAAAPARARLDSVDLVRGAVMIVMALDHARDFWTNPRPDPTDLQHTTAALFATRWITHFCAPVFSFLAGTGAFLSKKPKRELAWFLLTRGLWLIVLELTVVHVGFLGPQWNFNLFGTLWSLGWSMVALAGLIFLPTWVVAAISLAMILGHNAFDTVQGGVLWGVMHKPTFVPIGGGRTLFFLYPLIPWIGVMSAGYAFGEIMILPQDRRRTLLVALGAGMLLVFAALRGTNLYGDPRPWLPQKSALFTFYSFINCEKYPPSLLYLLVTLGPALLVLAALDGISVRASNPFVVFGRVPMLYYVLHIYVFHIPALIFWYSKYGPKAFEIGFDNAPPDFGVPLYVLYPVWLAGVIVLYPICRWYANLKRRNPSPWLSYL